jgi:hypothetical protein
MEVGFLSLARKLRKFLVWNSELVVFNTLAEKMSLSDLKGESWVAQHSLCYVWGGAHNGWRNCFFIECPLFLHHF